MPDEHSKRKRPFGVYAIIILLILHILSNSADVLRVRLGLPPLVLPNLDNQLIITALNATSVAIIVAVCIGLFFLKRWAWIAAMILIGCSLGYGIIRYLGGGQPFVAMVLDVISVFYLNQRNVQAAFEGREVGPRATA